MVEFLNDCIRAVIIGVALIVLTGCGHMTKIEYVTVDPPEPPAIKRPELPVLSAQPGDDAGTILQLHRETIKVLQSYAKELETALNAYRRKK